MFPQLQKADVANQVRAVDARVPGRDFTRKVTKREITNQNKPEMLASQEHQGPHGWIVGNIAEAMRKREEVDLERKKAKYEPADLEMAFERYLHERELRREQLEDDKWHTIEALARVIAKPQYAGVRIAGGDRALYERMFRAEPQKYMSRERFLLTMWRVYGFEIAQLEGVNDSKALDMLNRLYQAFDKENLNQVGRRMAPLVSTTNSSTDVHSPQLCTDGVADLYDDVAHDAGSHVRTPRAPFVGFCNVRVGRFDGLQLSRPCETWQREGHGRQHGARGFTAASHVFGEQGVGGGTLITTMHRMMLSRAQRTVLTVFLRRFARMMERQRGLREMRLTKRRLFRTCLFRSESLRSC
jgi:hypothetical protein